MTTIKQSTVSRGHLVLSLRPWLPTSTHGSGARIKAGQTISILGGGTFSNFLEPNLRQFEAELSSGEQVQVQGTSDCAEHQPLNPAVMMLGTWHMTRGYLDTTWQHDNIVTQSIVEQSIQKSGKVRCNIDMTPVDIAAVSIPACGQCVCRVMVREWSRCCQHYLLASSSS